MIATNCGEKKYWKYLGNESSMIEKCFRIRFACDRNIYNYLDNVMIDTSIILFCVFFCSFCVPEHEYKVPSGSVSTNF